MRRTPALIVGGGPAGAAAAICLARGGSEPHLIERTAGPHDVVCGGFLGWDALAALSGLGIDIEALGARPIEMLRLVAGEQTTEVRLPHRAAGLSRRRLDAALLDAASAAGAHLSRGMAVRSVDLPSRSVRLSDSEEIVCDALLLANGKHDLRGSPRQPAQQRSRMVLGLRTGLVAEPALEESLSGVLELHLFDGGYAGLLLQENGEANFCLSVTGLPVKDAGGIEELLGRLAAEQPLLRRRLAQPRAGTWTAIAGVPYGWRASQTLPGVFRLGDQAAVISSLAGDGIAIALRSGMQAASALLESGPFGAEAYQSRFAAAAALPLNLAGSLRWIAEKRLGRDAAMRLIRAAPSLARAAASLTRFPG